MISEQISNKRKFINNTSWILFERIVQMIIQLLVGLVSVRYLGPENYGTISYIGSFIALFNSICTLGLDGVVIKHIIDEPENTGEIVGTSIVMRIISSVISIIGILIMIYIVDDGNKNLLFLAILQSASLIFMSFEIIDFWFQSKLNSKYVSIAKTVATLVVSIWKVYLLATSKTLAYFAFSTTLQYIVIDILLMYLYFKQNGEKLEVSIKRAKALIKESYHFILSGMVVVIYSQMDKIMIGQMIDKEQVGIYTAASNIPGMYSFIFMAIINSSTPIILEANKKNNTEYLKRIKQLYSSIIWISIFISIIMVFASKLTMYILYGESYLAGAVVLNIAAWSNIFSVLGTARGIWIVAENKGKYVKKYLLWGAIVNLVLNSSLIPIYGINGAAIATLITQIVTCIIAPMFYKETRVHSKYVYEAMLLKWEEEINVNIKYMLKQSKIIMNIYTHMESLYMKLLTSISPVYASKYRYKKIFKKSLDLETPKTYNEKLMWLKLYWRDPLKSICADKYAVRDYVEKKGEGSCLNELYSVYNSVEEIKWDELPNEFVLKANNASGTNIICNDKSKLSEKETLKKIRKWMKDRFYLKNAEIHYKDIKPTIICEKYLKPKNGLLPIDYKIYCFDGIPKVVMICTERETGIPRYYFCDLDGNVLPFDETGKLCIKNGIDKIKLPNTAKEMYRISRNLSKGIPFVRIDFYDHNGKVIFGEMTFTPAACLDNSILEEGEYTMGEWIQLPKK